ncbi:hypothetical protein LCL85_19870 [Vibrio alginolyticus]|nr:hypothetical protein [Vibrio alginolyticus]
MNVNELKAELDTFNTEFHKKVNAEIAILEPRLKQLEAATSEHGMREYMSDLLTQTKPSKDVSQLILNQWITSNPAALNPEFTHFLITSADIGSPISQIGHKVHSLGEDVYYKTLRSIHAACHGALDTGMISVNKGTFKHPEITSRVLTHFCRSVDSEKTENYLEQVEEYGREIESITNDLAVLKEML